MGLDLDPGEDVPHVPSRQEMFNRAWNGLKSQGWKRSTVRSISVVDDKPLARCRYVGENGRRCAWGWVDPEGTNNADGWGGVKGLAANGIGLAAYLSNSDIGWAAALQSAHDACTDGMLEVSMRAFAEKNGLTIPE